MKSMLHFQLKNFKKLKENATREVNDIFLLFFPLTGILQNTICLESVQPTRKEVSSC